MPLDRTPLVIGGERFEPTSTGWTQTHDVPAGLAEFVFQEVIKRIPQLEGDEEPYGDARYASTPSQGRDRSNCILMAMWNKVMAKVMVGINSRFSAPPQPISDIALETAKATREVIAGLETNEQAQTLKLEHFVQNTNVRNLNEAQEALRELFPGAEINCRNIDGCRPFTHTDFEEGSRGFLVFRGEPTRQLEVQIQKNGDGFVLVLLERDIWDPVSYEMGKNPLPGPVVYRKWE